MANICFCEKKKYYEIFFCYAMLFCSEMGHPTGPVEQTLILTLLAHT